jgi:hypothetical protein
MQQVRVNILPGGKTGLFLGGKTGLFLGGHEDDGSLAIRTGKKSIFLSDHCKAFVVTCSWDGEKNIMDKKLNLLESQEAHSIVQ